MGGYKMKINVVCVGKIKEKYFTDAINEYAKRISRFAEFKVIECAEFPVKTKARRKYYSLSKRKARKHSNVSRVCHIDSD